MHTFIGHWVALLTAIGLPACQDSSQPRAADPAVLAESVLVIRNVTVIPMQTAAVMPARTVVIRGGRVDLIGPAASTPVPLGAAVIDGAGRFLMPGLIDAHVHMRRADAAAYLRAGILTVRNMWGHSGISPLMDATLAGTVQGPDIVSTSPGLDGTPPQWPETQIVEDPAKADSVVGAQVNAGWRYIKVYQQLTAPVFAAIARAAQTRGVRFLGHVPTRVSIDSALASGMYSIEHLAGYDQAFSRTHRGGTWGWSDADTSRFAELAATTQRRGVWNVPTLAIYVALSQQHPEHERPRIIASRRQFVAALHRSGALIAAGTDAGINVVAPGTSLLDELRELEAAGLTRRDALLAATVQASRLIGREDLGRIAVGSPAQLVLLSGNPLDDLGALARVVGIVRHGAWTRLDSIVTAPTAATVRLDVAGTYATQVSITQATCPNPGIQQHPTVVTQAASNATITLAHAGTTYVGTVQDGGRFTTTPKVLDFGGTIYTLTITGSFIGASLDAQVRVQQGAGGQPACEYTVRWAGSKM